MKNLSTYMKAEPIQAAAVVDESTLIYGTDLELSVESIEGVCVEAELEMLQLDNTLDQTTPIIASFESIQSYLASAKAEGGLNAQSAGFVNSIYAAISANMDGEVVEELPSMESYNADGAALGETEIAMEGVAQMIDKLWNAVRSILAAGVALAKKIYAQQVTLVGRVEKNAESVIAAAAKVKGKPAAKTVKPGGLEYMYSEGKPVEIKQFATLALYLKAVTKGSKSIGTALKSYEDAIASAKGSDLASANSKIKAASKSLQEALKTAFGTSKVLKETDHKALGLQKSFDSHLVSHMLPGGRQVVVSIPKEGSDLSTTWLLAVNKQTVGTELPALTSGEAVTMAKDAGYLCKGVKELTAEGDKLTAICKDLISAGEKAVSVVKGNPEAKGEQVQDFVDAISDLKAISKLARVPYIDLAKYATQVANSDVLYAAASLKNLGKPAPEPKEGE